MVSYPKYKCHKLGLNDRIEDRRQKFTFHGLRHTFASLVEDGTDLFTVKELLGHADYAMAPVIPMWAPNDFGQPSTG